MATESQLDAALARTAITDRDATSLTEHLAAVQFVLIHIEEPGEGDDDDGLGALTADVEGQPYLVAFSSQEHAAEFVRDRGDLFDNQDEIGGFLVEGTVVLDYLGADYGLLINPESEDICLIDRELVADMLDELGLE